MKKRRRMLMDEVVTDLYVYQENTSVINAPYSSGGRFEIVKPGTASSPYPILCQFTAEKYVGTPWLKIGPIDFTKYKEMAFENFLLDGYNEVGPTVGYGTYWNPSESSVTNPQVYKTFGSSSISDDGTRRNLTFDISNVKGENYICVQLSTTSSSTLTRYISNIILYA